MATYVPNSYQSGLVAQGYTDNGDGSFTSPDGQVIIPQMSQGQSADVNNLASNGLAALSSGYGSNDPTFDPRYALLSAEHNLNPGMFGAGQPFSLPSGTELDASGNIRDKPPSFWAQYGPWLALAGAGGFMAAPAIAGAFGAAGAGGAAAAPVSAAAEGTGAAATAATSPGIFSGLFGAGGAGGAAAGGSTLGSLMAPAAASSLWTNPMFDSGLVGGAFNTLGGLINAHAQNSAANTQAAATEKAAQMQSDSAANTLNFLKSQAALSTAQQAATQYGNYEQWVAQQQRVGTLGQLLGLGPRPIPSYVPMPTGVGPNGAPTYSGPGAPVTPTAPAPPTTIVPPKRFVYQAPPGITPQSLAALSAGA